MAQLSGAEPRLSRRVAGLAAVYALFISIMTGQSVATKPGVVATSMENWYVASGGADVR